MMPCCETTLVERDFFLWSSVLYFSKNPSLIVCLFQTFDSPTPRSPSPTQKDLKGKYHRASNALNVNNCCTPTLLLCLCFELLTIFLSVWFRKMNISPPFYQPHVVQKTFLASVENKRCCQAEWLYPFAFIFGKRWNESERRVKLSSWLTSHLCSTEESYRGLEQHEDEQTMTELWNYKTMTVFWSWCERL